MRVTCRSHSLSLKNLVSAFRTPQGAGRCCLENWGQEGCTAWSARALSCLCASGRNRDQTPVLPVPAWRLQEPNAPDRRAAVWTTRAAVGDTALPHLGCQTQIHRCGGESSQQGSALWLLGLGLCSCWASPGGEGNSFSGALWPL